MNKALLSTGLSEQVIQNIQSVFSNNDKVQLVILYGSRAKGNFHQGSDIDLTIMGDHLDFSDVLRIDNQLDDLLLPYKIDLSLYQSIKNTDLIDHIQRVGKILYPILPQNKNAMNYHSIKENKPLLELLTNYRENLP